MTYIYFNIIINQIQHLELKRNLILTFGMNQVLQQNLDLQEELDREWV